MEKKGVLLIGPYFSGKTSCTKLIGKKTGWGAFDLDEMYTKRFGESIWATRNVSEGPARAAKNRDQIGFEIIESIKNNSPSIVVFGGGSFFRDHPEYLEEVKKTHVAIYLRPSRSILVDRALRDKSQAENQFLFRDSKADEIDYYFEQYFKKVGTSYIQWADRIIEPGSDWKNEEVCFHVLSAFAKEGIK